MLGTRHRVRALIVTSVGTVPLVALALMSGTSPAQAIGDPLPVPTVSVSPLPLPTTTVLPTLPVSTSSSPSPTASTTTTASPKATRQPTPAPPPTSTAAPTPSATRSTTAPAAGPTEWSAPPSSGSAAAGFTSSGGAGSAAAGSGGAGQPGVGTGGVGLPGAPGSVGTPPEQMPQGVAPPATGALPAAGPPVLSPFVARTGFSGYVAVSGSRSTQMLMQQLASLNLTPALLAAVFAPFPVAGPASYSNDWQAPRFFPTFHLHQGTDIFAERGTPVIASSDGVIGHVAHDSAVGGNSLRLTGSDGTYYYYAHLDTFALGVADGVPVRTAQVLGFVGNTGDAETTPTHLHFEIHPGGGVAVAPLPYLDRWLSDAQQRIDTLATAPGSAQAQRLRTAVPPPLLAAAPLSVESNTAGVPFAPANAAATATSPWGFQLLIAAIGALIVWRRLRRGHRARARQRRAHRLAISRPDVLPAALRGVRTAAPAQA